MPNPAKNTLRGGSFHATVTFQNRRGRACSTRGLSTLSPYETTRFTKNNTPRINKRRWGIGFALLLVLALTTVGQSIGWVRIGGFYPDSTLGERFYDKYLIEDVNGDSFPEISISGYTDSTYFARFYWGGSGAIDTLPDFEIVFPYEGTGYEAFSFTLASPYIGDVNGDGWNDLGIRMPGYGDEYYTHDCGALFLYWGGPSLDTIYDWFYSDSTVFYQNLGTELVGVGDWNGDGYDDFAASAPDGWEAYGYVCFFLGGDPPATTPAKVWQGGTILYRLGNSLIAGQFISDSLLDLMWVSPSESYETRITKIEYVIGTPSFVTSDFAEVCQMELETSYPEMMSLHNLGDINNDGFDDIWLENEYMEHLPSFENGWHILLGGEDSITHVVLDSAEWFGKRFYGIEDINSDGIDDFYTYNGGTIAHYGGIEVFSGDSFLEFESLYENDSVQSRHSNAKDLNDDGYPEVVCYVGGWNLYTFNADYIVDIPEHENKPNDIEICAYPNPFNSAVSISAPENAIVEIFDLNGRIVYEMPVGSRHASTARQNATGDDIAAGQPPVDLCGNL